MKPLDLNQSINIPMPRIQVGGGEAVGTPVGELVEKRDLDGLHSHGHGALFNNGNSNILVDANGKPRRRSISAEGMA